MMGTTRSSTSTLSPFEAGVTEAYAASLPKDTAALTVLRQEGYKRFIDLGMPTRHLESYKYVAVDNLSKTPVVPSPATAVADTVVQAATLPEASGQILVFINGQWSPEHSDLSQLSAGVSLTPLSQLTTSPVTVPPFQGIFSQLQEETDALSAMTVAMAEEGLLLKVDKDVEVKAPIQLIFVSSTTPSPTLSPNLAFIHLASHARLTVVETHLSTAANSLPISSLSGIRTLTLYGHLNPGANLDWVVMDTTTDSSALLNHRYWALDRDATLQQFTLALGSQLSRYTSTVTLQGEQAHAGLTGLTMVDNQRQAHHHLHVIHQSPHGTSEQLYKTIAQDTATGDFDGTITIVPGAHHTDAQQLNKNLLLSPTAKVFTRPQLNIDADDVKCAHGATVGQLEEEELFYLVSRGIPTDRAQEILIQGFVRAVIEALPLESLRISLVEQLAQRLRS